MSRNRQSKPPRVSTSGELVALGEIIGRVSPPSESFRRTLKMIAQATQSMDVSSRLVMHLPNTGTILEQAHGWIPGSANRDGPAPSGEQSAFPGRPQSTGPRNPLAQNSSIPRAFPLPSSAEPGNANHQPVRRSKAPASLVSLESWAGNPHRNK
ncbi:uncharacterized protein BJX67DRAFT_19052 [Aspergillus lucknowensis]|uniref:Uncharacterized protein n=1 Tax=Aspergillus lucknowensis TaxID=176173 RepID=A0ABR4M877_9EURO